MQHSFGSAVAPTRLRLPGLELPEALPKEAELALYERLNRAARTTPTRYGAPLRELDSIIEALESRRRRERHASE